MSFKYLRDGDSTTSLGSLFQCLTNLLVKKFFLIPNVNLPWGNLRPFPLVLSSCFPVVGKHGSIPVQFDSQGSFFIALLEGLALKFLGGQQFKEYYKNAQRLKTLPRRESRRGCLSKLGQDWNAVPKTTE